MLDRWFARVPASLATPLAVAAAVIAMVGALLVVIATAYGDGAAAAGAVAVFVVAGLVWQAADHAHNTSSASVRSVPRS